MDKQKHLFEFTAGKMSISSFCVMAILMIFIFLPKSNAEENNKPFRVSQEEQNVIFVANGNNVRAQFRQAAAKELAYFLRKITGLEIPIVQDAEKLNGKISGIIYIGESDYTNEHNLGNDLSAFGAGGFLIKTISGNLAILGYDTDFGSYQYRAQGDTGTGAGVMAFLEDYAGVRFLWPGEFGTVIPQKKEIIVPAFTEIRRRPAIPYRRLDDYTEVNAKLLPNGKIKLWSAFDSRHATEWSLFLRRVGCGQFIQVHASHMKDHYLKDSDFQRHPEWFAYYGEKRHPHKETEAVDYGGAQLCQSNQEVINILAERIIKKSEILHGDAKRYTFSLTPCDGERFCVCEKCKEMDKGARPWPGNCKGFGQLAGKVYNEKYGCVSDLSNRIWNFNNQVARKVADADPEIMLSCAAYGAYRTPPRDIMKIEDNIVVLFSDIFMGNGTASEREKGFQMFNEWSQKARHLGIYSYYYLMGSRPHLAVEIVRRTYNMGSIAHTTGILQTFGFKWIHLVAHIKAMWNPFLNTDELINDYYNAAYGNGAPAMLKYLKLQEQVSMSYNTFATFDEPEETANAWHSEVRKKLRSYLDEALTATKGSREHTARIRFTESSWEMLDSYCELYGRLKKLKEFGLPVPYVKTDKNMDASETELRSEIKTAWQEWLRLYNIMTASEKTESFSIPWYNYFAHAESAEGRVIYAWSKLINNLGEQVLNHGGIPLPAKWKFQLDPNNIGIASRWNQPDYDDKNWPDISTDDWWENQGYGINKFPENGKDGYNGKAWYRISVKIPDEKKGHKAILELGAVDESCTVWINGKLAGKSLYIPEKDPELWKKNRSFDISSLLEYGKDNSIAIEVEDKNGWGGIWKPCFILFPSETSLKPESTFLQLLDDSGQGKTSWYAKPIGNAKISMLKKKVEQSSL